MINKNKKRLLSAFVSAMLICPITNGMESYERIIVPGFKEKGNAYIREFPGEALNQLRKKYEPINNDKIFAGHAGVVSQYCCIESGENYGKIVAVKCTVNPDTTGIKTFNNVKSHYNDSCNEMMFFEETEHEPFLWKTSLYDYFSDDNVSYIVTDWVEGKTLHDWIQDIQNQKNLPLIDKLSAFSEIIFQIVQIMKDLDDITRINTGLHGGNIMVESINNKISLRVVDHGKYRYRDQVNKPLETCIAQLVSIMKKMDISTLIASNKNSSSSEEFCKKFDTFLKKLGYQFNKGSIKNITEATNCCSLKIILDAAETLKENVKQIESSGQ